MKLLIFLLLFGLQAVGQVTQHLIGPLPAYNGQHSGTKIPYVKYTPLELRNSPGSTKKYPVIIHYHGIGERTSSYSTMASVSTGDLNKLIISGTGLPAHYANASSDLSGDKWRVMGDSTGPQYEFFIYAPQCWQGYSYFYPIYGDAMLDEVALNPNADLDRVYIVGLSFGGGHVLVTLQDPNIADRVAGAFANCAGYNRYAWDNPSHSDYTSFSEWNGYLLVAHSINDSVTDAVPTCCPKGPGSYYSDRAVDSINNRYKGRTTVEYIRYTTGNHNIWERAYTPTNSTVSYPTANGQSMTWGIPFQSRLLTRSLSRNRRQ